MRRMGSASCRDKPDAINVAMTSASAPSPAMRHIKARCRAWKSSSEKTLTSDAGAKAEPGFSTTEVVRYLSGEALVQSGGSVLVSVCPWTVMPVRSDVWAASSTTGCASTSEPTCWSKLKIGLTSTR